MVERQIKDDRRRNWFSLILGAAFLVGCVLGLSAIIFADGQCAIQLQNYLSDYLLLTDLEFPARSAAAVFWSYVRWPLFCILFGFCCLNLFCLPILFGFRGFLFAFGFGCFIRFWGSSGMLPAFILFGLTAVIWLPGMLLCGVYALDLSVGSLHRNTPGIRIFFGKDNLFRRCILLCLLLCLACTWLECTLFPILLPMAARIIL